MTIDLFRQSFDTLFLSELDRLLSQAKNKVHNPYIHGLLDHVYELAKNGKRIRPYVMVRAYGAKTFDDASPIYNQLVGIELLHLFALIHDDIMDDALTRHGVKSINAFADDTYKNNSSISSSQGKYEAILVGDIVYSFACNTFSKGAAPHILQVFYELIDEVVLGQMIDIRIPFENDVNESVIHERMLLKTARYSFARPMQIGAMLALKSDEEIQTLFNLGEEFGIIFQITDDIIDITGDKNITKKVPLQDLFNGQETFLTFYLKTQKPEFFQKLQKYTKRKLDETEASEAIELFRESGALLFAQEYIQKHKANAQKHIEAISDQNEWSVLLEKILQRES